MAWPPRRRSPATSAEHATAGGALVTAGIEGIAVVVCFVVLGARSGSGAAERGAQPTANAIVKNAPATPQ